MYRESVKAMFSAVRLLFKSPRTLLLMVAGYGGLILAGYLFVSTREATIVQLIITVAVVVAAPGLFFVLQAAGVSYTSGPTSVRKLGMDGLKLTVVSLPLIALTIVGVYGLNKVQSHVTTATTLRYLLVGVIAPLLAIQVWIAVSKGGFRGLAKGLRSVFAPHSMFVYACGFLIFAVVPYFLLNKTFAIERDWLEFSVLLLRLAVSAALILLGWITTIGALAILNCRGGTPWPPVLPNTIH
jgi:hypothetical protein